MLRRRHPVVGELPKPGHQTGLERLQLPPLDLLCREKKECGDKACRLDLGGAIAYVRWDCLWVLETEMEMGLDDTRLANILNILDKERYLVSLCRWSVRNVQADVFYIQHFLS